MAQQSGYLKFVMEAGQSAEGGLELLLAAEAPADDLSIEQLVDLVAPKGSDERIALVAGLIMQGPRAH